MRSLVSPVAHGSRRPSIVVSTASMAFRCALRSCPVRSPISDVSSFLSFASFGIALGCTPFVSQSSFRKSSLCQSVSRSQVNSAAISMPAKSLPMTWSKGPCGPPPLALCAAAARRSVSRSVARIWLIPSR